MKYQVTAYVLIVALAFLAACSQDDPAAPAPQPADLEEFFNQTPAWDLFSPPQADADVAIGEPASEEKMIDGSPYECTTTPYSLTRTPEKIVTLNPDVEILWVGSLLQGKGYVGGIGSLSELAVRQRNPITLTIDLLTSDNSRTVSKPTVATSNQAIGDLIQQAMDAGHQAGSNILFTKETMYTYNQMALKMGLSASYSGATIKSSLSADISSEIRSMTAYFVQRMFTVSMVLPQNPEDVFSGEFTAEMLQRETSNGHMGPDNPPVYVSSIAYGRILMFSFTSSASETDINATLNVLYNNGQFGGDLEAKYKDILEQAQIRVVTVGGDADQALALIRANDLGAYFAEDAPLSTAKPISYTVRHLKDNAIASVAEATEYNLTTCTPKALPVTGSEYYITFTSACGESFPFVDDSLAEGIWDAEAYYSFSVEDANGSQKGIEWMSQKEFDYVYKLKQGECRTLVDRAGQSAKPLKVTIHYDGRENVRVFGSFWDADILDPDDLLASFNYVYQWPARPMQVGEATIVAGDAWGNKVRLRWRVTKGADLTD
ncbi:MAG TPA: thiol-activated cytolysin family protein [Candidatus Krumholzibacteria bacterium]|nr:thiol-activated cytolysin family protein [Candidatus Krumholzibacteria bacterium]